MSSPENEPHSPKNWTSARVARKDEVEKVIDGIGRAEECRIGGGTAGVLVLGLLLPTLARMRFDRLLMQTVNDKLGFISETYTNCKLPAALYDMRTLV